MKTIEEQTAVEAYNYASKNTDGNHSKTKAINDFISGAEWERNRNKWISVERDLPEPFETVWLSNGNGWTTLGCRTPLDPDGNWCWAQTNGIIYEENGKIISECESDDLDVIFWSHLPEPPKQKED